MEYVNKKYLNHKNFNEALWVVGLRDGRDFQYSLSRFEFLMHLREGNFVFHQGGWGVGEVMGVSFLQQKILVEFEGVMMAKDISFETAFKTLRPLSKEHFLSRRFGDPDKFEEYAKEHPVEVIEILLRDLGPKTAKEIKDELVDLVIPEENWEQKRSDVHEYHIDTFVIGDDWTGKFDFLREEGCEVVYLPRTPEISTTKIKKDLH